jgi:hypothetical protein
MTSRQIVLTGLVIMLAPPMLPAALAQTTQQPDVVVDREAGLAEWDRIEAVFSHPRCANCHVEDERPRWSGPHYGATRVHGFNVTRGDDGSGFGNTGMRCTTCHFEGNSPVLHGPPGAHNWHLAPAGMAWFDKSSAEICAQIKDPARNGDRTLDEIALHVRDDALVAWGWQPGPGREPAPGSAEETYRAIERWNQAGAPCPEG